MQLQREATNLIEQFARLPKTREHLPEQQRLLEALVSQYGIWNGFEGGCHCWYSA